MNVSIIDLIGKSFVFLFSTPRLFVYAVPCAFLLYMTAYHVDGVDELFDQMLSVRELLVALTPVFFRELLSITAGFLITAFFTIIALHVAQHQSVRLSTAIVSAFKVLGAGCWVVFVSTIFEFARIFFMHKPVALNENIALLLLFIMLFFGAYFALLKIFIVPLLADGIYNPFYLLRRAYALLHISMSRVLVLFFLTTALYVLGVVLVMFFMTMSGLTCTYFAVHTMVCSSLFQKALENYVYALFIVCISASKGFLYLAVAKNVATELDDQPF